MLTLRSSRLKAAGRPPPTHRPGRPALLFRPAGLLAQATLPLPQMGPGWSLNFAPRCGRRTTSSDFPIPLRNKANRTPPKHVEAPTNRTSGAEIAQNISRGILTARKKQKPRLPFRVDFRPRSVLCLFWLIPAMDYSQQQYFGGAQPYAQFMAIPPLTPSNSHSAGSEEFNNTSPPVSGRRIRDPLSWLLASFAASALYSLFAVRPARAMSSLPASSTDQNAPLAGSV